MLSGSTTTFRKDKLPESSNHLLAHVPVVDLTKLPPEDEAELAQVLAAINRVVEEQRKRENPDLDLNKESKRIFFELRRERRR